MVEEQLFVPTDVGQSQKVCGQSSNQLIVIEQLVLHVRFRKLGEMLLSIVLAQNLVNGEGVPKR